ncbi:ABC transporter-like protein [Marssonina coronariae]|uniref:ABC transporter-like protein n=1 Tax=Diplocarpon coronariae TaxID=2795749 RepID=A0A218ZE97_9HELO|nr:ABC transporter-like protein [Marssonina coronariae]
MALESRDFGVVRMHPHTISRVHEHLRIFDTEYPWTWMACICMKKSPRTCRVPGILLPDDDDDADADAVIRTPGSPARRKASQYPHAVVWSTEPGCDRRSLLLLAGTASVGHRRSPSLHDLRKRLQPLPLLDDPSAASTLRPRPLDAARRIPSQRQRSRRLGRALPPTASRSTSDARDSRALLARHQGNQSCLYLACCLQPVITRPSSGDREHLTSVDAFYASMPPMPGLLHTIYAGCRICLIGRRSYRKALVVGDLNSNHGSVQAPSATTPTPTVHLPLHPLPIFPGLPSAPSAAMSTPYSYMSMQQEVNPQLRAGHQDLRGEPCH